MDAFNTWQEKTEWVQKDKRFDVLLPWGKHRADVLKEYIDHLEAKCAALAAELEDAEKRIAELERGSKVIKCWSCQKSVTVDQVTAEDGFCPSCNCGIDLEDYEIAELLATGIITKVGE